MSSESTSALPAVVEDGRFQPGKSGNPKGRPPTLRESIAVQQTKLEAAIRHSLGEDKAIAIVTRLANLAIKGDPKDAVKAAAALLPYLLTKPSAETRGDGPAPIVIRIENATDFVRIKDVTPLAGEFKEIINERVTVSG